MACNAHKKKIRMGHIHTIYTRSIYTRRFKKWNIYTTNVKRQWHANEDLKMKLCIHTYRDNGRQCTKRTVCAKCIWRQAKKKRKKNYVYIHIETMAGNAQNVPCARNAFGAKPKKKEKKTMYTYI